MVCVQAQKRERESVFETYSNLLKFAIARIESSNAVRELRAGAQDILNDYMTKVSSIVETVL